MFSGVQGRGRRKVRTTTRTKINLVPPSFTSLLHFFAINSHNHTHHQKHTLPFFHHDYCRRVRSREGRQRPPMPRGQSNPHHRRYIRAGKSLCRSSHAKNLSAPLLHWSPGTTWPNVSGWTGKTISRRERECNVLAVRSRGFAASQRYLGPVPT